MSTFAIVETGGKQYRVQAGDTIRVESLPGHEDDLVELGEVLLVSKDGRVTVGTPIVESATVTTELVGHGKSKKIIVFKYKAKTRYRRKSGHRQMYTDLRVTGISV